MVKNIETVATHDGKFHSDEVFAVAMLKILFPKIEVIRTRNKEEYDKADIRVDVGGIYDYENGNFDHHQQAFKDERKNGTGYSSAGLIWKEYGRKITSSEAVWSFVDEMLVQPIDLDDLGKKYYITQNIRPITLHSLIDEFPIFRPNWKETQNLDKGFNKAVSFAKEIIERFIAHAESLDEAKIIVQKAIKSSNGKYLFLENPLPPHNETIRLESNIEFVIYPYNKTTYAAKGVPLSEGSYSVRRMFPAKWAGLENEELAKFTGVKGALFCHKGRFIVTAKTKQDCIDLVEKAFKSM